MIDAICLWTGRAIILSGGICLALCIVGLSIEWLWSTLKYRAYFIDICAIYMQKGRRAAKARAASLPRQPYP